MLPLEPEGSWPGCCHLVLSVGAPRWPTTCMSGTGVSEARPMYMSGNYQLGRSVRRQLGQPGKTMIWACCRAMTVVVRLRPLLVVSCGPNVARPSAARNIAGNTAVSHPRWLLTDNQGLHRRVLRLASRDRQMSGMGWTRHGTFQRSRTVARRRTGNLTDRSWTNVPPGWWMAPSAVLVEGREDLEVVGESRYQDNLWRLAGRPYDPGERVREEITAVLVAEPDNVHDANAISIWIDGLKVGYLSREDAQRHHAGLLALQDKHRMPVALSGVIAGGGLRDDGPGRLGVFLRYDPAEFGLNHPTSPFPSESMRTGMSDALATDEADETYDLAWMRDLPADDIRAIPRSVVCSKMSTIPEPSLHVHAIGKDALPVPQRLLVSPGRVRRRVRQA